MFDAAGLVVMTSRDQKQNVRHLFLNTFFFLSFLFR